MTCLAFRRDGPGPGERRPEPRSGSLQALAQRLGLDAAHGSGIGG